MRRVYHLDGNEVQEAIGRFVINREGLYGTFTANVTIDSRGGEFVRCVVEIEKKDEPKK